MSVWRTLLRKSGLWTADTEDEVRHRPTDGAGHGETPAMRAAALERILQESIEARGSTDPRSITARNNLASKYAQIGRRSAAIAQFELVLTDAAATFGDDHPQTDVIRENLAWSYEDAGRYDDASGQWESLLRHRDKNLGSTAGDTVAARTRLAQCYRRSNRPDAAIAHFEQALEDSAAPEERENLRIGLSMAFASAGRYNDTVQQLRIVLAQRQRRLGSRHHDTLVIHHRLGRTCTQAGQVSEAVETLQAAYRGGLAAAGDPEIRVLTMKMRRDLAGALSAAGRHRDAAALF